MKLSNKRNGVVEYPTGTKEWYSNGILHRTEGPAYEGLGGYQEWWLDNTHYTFDEWFKLSPLTDREKLLLAIQHSEDR